MTHRLRPGARGAIAVARAWAGRAPFLSVVIPTFNRADELDRQLRWLHDELRALDVSWEVRVHDNCSSDHTPEVLARWQEEFGPDVFHVVRNERNVGGVPNLAEALAGARGDWVWSVGDDDEIHDGACAHLVDTLRAQPDLTLLYLSYRGVDASTRQVTVEHFFDPAQTGRFEDGRRAFAHHAIRGIGSVIFLTSTVYRTDVVHAALEAWRDDVRNWALVAYWTGYAAARGPIYITPEKWIDCAVGVSHWQSEGGGLGQGGAPRHPKGERGALRGGLPPRLLRAVGSAGQVAASPVAPPHRRPPLPGVPAIVAATSGDPPGERPTGEPATGGRAGRPVGRSCGSSGEPRQRRPARRRPLHGHAAAGDCAAPARVRGACATGSGLR